MKQSNRIYRKEARARITALKEELGLVKMQLQYCMWATMGDDFQEQILKEKSIYWTDAGQHVIELRQKYEELVKFHEDKLVKLFVGANDAS